MPALQPKRVLPFAGGHNFRDIGGYPTRDGRTTAWGLVYRSGSMAALSDADHDLLGSLKLALVCDLRSTRERGMHPSRFPDTVDFEVWARDHNTSAGDVVEAIQKPEAHSGMAREMMIEMYKDLAYEQAESYIELFQRLAAGSLPLVFHCAAGKDRTGIAAAILLDMLGVEREAVVADYVMTDDFFDQLCEMVLADPIASKLAALDPAIWAPLMRADAAYVETMLDTITARHGSSEGFVREILGLGTDEIAAIRERLLV
ncbi:MAG: protein tyrosine/serine phosphatase [Sphingomonadales bacterium]|jgi:protein-tyrosine phosphatase|nr:protein tyrosine/serine phosphatase [Sphingomonadales bacterium]